jgi:hypothetical protein
LKRAIASSVMLMVACSSGPGVGDLPQYVLASPPKGTVISERSGERTLEDLTEGNQDKAERYRQAGFKGAYQRIFEEPSGFGERPDSSAGLLLISGAALFEDADAGVEAIRQTILDEGDATQLRPLEFSPFSYVAKGTLDRGLPPGILMVWPHDDVVMYLAAVAFGDITESTLRQIAAAVEEGAP